MQTGRYVDLQDPRFKVVIEDDVEAKQFIARSPVLQIRLSRTAHKVV